MPARIMEPTTVDCEARVRTPTPQGVASNQVGAEELEGSYTCQRNQGIGRGKIMRCHPLRYAYADGAS